MNALQGGKETHRQLGSCTARVLANAYAASNPCARGRQISNNACLWLRIKSDVARAVCLCCDPKAANFEMAFKHARRVSLFMCGHTLRTVTIRVCIDRDAENCVCRFIYRLLCMYVET